mmetsp:Transcript_13117/g.2002  ORF Transcript_13117/g.2002 Transcript_13117/m.2002 type:complete len:108 (+) Transcript_13117:603-926(+)
MGVVVIYLYSEVDKRIGWFLCVFLIILSCFFNMIIVGAYDLPHIMPFNTDDFEDTHTFMELSYVKPYGRFTIYFIGVMCGFVLYHYREFLEKGSCDDQRALTYAYMM